MKNYIAELNAFLAVGGMDCSDANFGKVADGEKVVGECSDKVKTIVAFMRKLEDDLGDRLSCLEATDEKKDPTGHARWEGEAYLIREKLRATAGLLWITIHEEDPRLLSVKNLGIRAGWKIVHSPVKIPLEAIASAVLKIITQKNSNGFSPGNN